MYFHVSHIIREPHHYIIAILLTKYYHAKCIPTDRSTGALFLSVNYIYVTLLYLLDILHSYSHNHT